MIATLGEAATINPFLTNESEGDWRCRMLFDRFVRINPTTYAPGAGSGLRVDDRQADVHLQDPAEREVLGRHRSHGGRRRIHDQGAHRSGHRLRPSAESTW